MTSVRQILRCTQRLVQLQESGAKLLNRSVRCASTQARHKIIEDENGKKIFPSPYGDVTPCEMHIQEFIWKNIDKYANKTALVISFYILQFYDLFRFFLLLQATCFRETRVDDYEL